MSSRHALPHDQRAVELLVDRALFGLAESEQRELRQLAELCPEIGDPDDGFTLIDAAVAELQLSTLHPLALPDRLVASLEVAADAWQRDAIGVIGHVGPLAPRVIAPRSPARPGPDQASDARVLEVTRSAGLWSSLGWLAAAAAITLLAVVWTNRQNPSSTFTGGAPVAITPQAALEQVLAAKDAIKSQWGPFNALDSGEAPELSGISGEVAWSDSRQLGVMTFRGLPVNDPTREQYQLWIVDATRGLDQRVSGGIFDVSRAQVDANGEIRVVFSPAAVKVNKAAVFALTIEKPGGVVVSDMKRRVVLAAVKS